jgi:hypothetical protein
LDFTLGLRLGESVLSPSALKFCLGVSLMVPSLWKLSGKRFRVKLGGGKFVKLNCFENVLRTLLG